MKRLDEDALEKSGGDVKESALVQKELALIVLPSKVRLSVLS